MDLGIIEIGTLKQGEEVEVYSSELPEDYEFAPNGNNFVEADTQGLDVNVWIWGPWYWAGSRKTNWWDITNRKIRLTPIPVNNKLKIKIKANQNLTTGDTIIIKIYRVFSESSEGGNES